MRPHKVPLKGVKLEVRTRIGTSAPKPTLNHQPYNPATLNPTPFGLLGLLKDWVSALGLGKVAALALCETLNPKASTPKP